MKKKTSSIFFMLLIIASKIIATNTCSLETYWELLKKHPHTKKIKYQILLEEETSNKEKEITDWTFEIQPSSSYEKPIGESIFSAKERNINSLNISRRRKIWATGGNISLNAGLSYTKQTLDKLEINNEEITLGKEKEVKNKISINYEHPLLRNKHGIQDKVSYLNQKLNEQIMKLQLKEQQEKFKLKKTMDFIDWVTYYELKQINEERIKIAKEQLNIVKERLQNNLTEKIDLLVAEDQLRIALQNNEKNNGHYRSKKTYINKILQNKDFKEKDPEFDFYNYKKIKKEKNILRIQKEYEYAKEQITEKIKSKQNDILPELSINLSGGTQSNNSEIKNIIIPNKPHIKGYILYKKAEKNSRKKQEEKILKVKMEVIKNSYKEKIIESEAKREELLSKIDSIIKIIEINKDHIHSTEKRYLEEINRYKKGDGELQLVIQAKDNQENAKLMLIENLYLYHQNYFRYLEESDLLEI
ncbi:MAG: hypothetical protein VW378_01140 [bacterium]